jgi:hypothetical protein
MDIERCAAWKACSAGRASVLIHRGAVATEDAAEERWKAASCGRFFVVAQQASAGLRRIRAAGVWRWRGWGWRFVKRVLPGGGLRCFVEVVPDVKR